MSSNVLIGIASEFDAKGFKQAQTATSQLDKTAKKLAKTLAGAFSVHKVIQYSKQSVLAYANDQKAAALLANQLKNLGLSYSAVGVEKFIAELQKQTGILDDELRPAFTNLVRITGSVAETQKLMMTAFDASRGAGIEYSQAVQLISRAYVGNYKGLKQLNLGLSDAELKTKSFSEVLTLINQKFKGAGAASVDTYAGKIDLLKVSLADAQETIGKGFVDAFEILAKDQNFNDVTNTISNMALNVADAIRGIGVALSFIDTNTPSWLKSLFSATQKTSVVGILSSIGKNARMADTSTSVGTSYYSKLAADRQAAAASAKLARTTNTILAANKKITAEKKAQAALDEATSKANALLSQANALFDLERIGVEAAMQNRTLTANEMKRLEIKQAIFNLEDAIEAKDAAKIISSTQVLNSLLQQFTVMQNQAVLLDKIKAAYDLLGMNKDLINLSNLQSTYDWLLKILDLMSKLGKFDPNGGGYNPNGGGKKPNVLNEADKPAGLTEAEWNKIKNDLDNASVEEVIAAVDAVGTASSFANLLSQNILANDTALKKVGGVTGALSAARYTGQALTWALQNNVPIDEMGFNSLGFLRSMPADAGVPIVQISVSENAKNLVDIIMDTVTQQSASGNSPIVNRIDQNLAW